MVLDLARLNRWATFHPFDSRRSASGWPDLALCRPPRLLLLELKREGGKLTEDQQRWLELLRQCPGVEVHCFRPADWDAIVKVLT
jgi:hypothetical protein